MTATTFNLPDLGEGLHDAEIVSWHVNVGDRVVAEQPLVTVETDKAIVDVPSPLSGRVEVLLAQPGDVVNVGAPLVRFAATKAQDTGVIVGDVTQPEVSGAPDAHATRDASITASPAVRRLADALGVDLAAVSGSGVGGSITRSDVEAAAAGTASGDPVRGVRRAMLKTMTRAGREVVHATVTDDADIDAWAASSDVTVRLIRAVVAGCRESPALNAWFDSATERREVHDHIDLGVAVETDQGLFAPVMRDVGNRDVEDLRRGLDALKQDIAARAVPRDALTGQTITLSNFGMFGGRYADLIVVPPQVAILGAGRVEQRAVAVGGQSMVHRVLPLSLSFDHRVVTGVEATTFLNAVVTDLETAD